MQLIRTVLQCVILTCCVVCAPSLATDYVGNESCQECHRNEVKNWQGSDHAKAMQVANEETVLGDFNHVRFESNDGWTVFNKDDKGYYIETGSKGQSGVRYRVPYVFGYYPLQQILVDIGQGRLQAYTVAWDARTDTEGGVNGMTYMTIHIRNRRHFTGKVSLITGMRAVLNVIQRI